VEWLKKPERKGKSKMPKVIFPYTKEGEKNARAAAREYGGRYISDKAKKKMKPAGMSVMIAVGAPTKKKPPARRTHKKKV